MAAAVGGITCCVSFAGKLFNFAVEKGSKGNANLVCRCVTYSNNGATVQVARKILESDSAAILDCRTLRVAETQRDFPFVLVRHGTCRPLSLYLCSPDGRSMDQLADGKDWNTRDDLEWSPRLVDGPAVLWKSGGAVHLTLFRPSPRGCKSWSVPMAALDRSLLLDAGTEFRWRSSVLDGSLRLTAVTASGAMEMLVAFSLAAATVRVLERWRMGPEHAVLDHLQLATAVLHTDGTDGRVLFLCTSGGRLVRLQLDTMSCRVCTIPFDDAVSIEIVKCGSALIGCCLVTSLDCGHCVVQLEAFEVVNRRDVPSVAFVDDFLQTGSRQILYLSRDGLAKVVPDRDFEIVDLKEANRSKDTVQVENVDASLSTAHRALRDRILDGRLLQSKADSHLEHLRRTVFDISATLRKVAVGDEGTVDERPHLFQLLTGEGTGPPVRRTAASQSPDRESDHSCRPLTVGLPWKKIVLDKWVMGVRVTNRSQRRIWNLRLVMCAPARDLSHGTRFRRVEAEAESDAESDAGLEPRQAANLTCTVAADILRHRDVVSVGLSVTFTRLVHDAEVSGCVSCPVVVHLYALDLVRNQIEEDLQDASQDQSEESLDLVAIKSATSRVAMTASSPLTNLTTLKTLLEDKTQFVFNDRFQIFVWSAKTCHVLRGVLLELPPGGSSTRVDLNIHARSREQLFATVHHLYDCLPHDVTFRLSEAPRDPTTLHDRLKSEAGFAADFLKELGNHPTTFVDDDDEIMIIGEESDVLIGNDTYQKFRNDLFDLETLTDRAFASALSLKS